MSMTDNTANIALCNESLGLLGAEEISVGATTEQNHIYCTTFFDSARDEILAAHRWNYAKKRAYAIETTTPIFGWDNAFTKPNDAIKVWAIEEAPDAEWEVEGGLILTNEGSAALSWELDKIFIAGQYITSANVLSLYKQGVGTETMGTADRRIRSQARPSLHPEK